MTDRTEALDIEADIALVANAVEFSSEPTEKAAFDRLIQALQASNEERERVRALVEKWRQDPPESVGGGVEAWRQGYHFARLRVADELEAALSHPISPEPETCPTCGNVQAWPVLNEQGRFRDVMRSCPDPFHRTPISPERSDADVEKVE